MRAWLTVLSLLASIGAVDGFALCPTVRSRDSLPRIRQHGPLKSLDRDTPQATEAAPTSLGETKVEVIQRRSSLPSLALPRLEKLSLSTDTSGYVVLGLCCAIATISSLDRVMMSVAILPMSAEMLYSDTTKGLIAAAFTTGYFIFFVPAGVVAATLSPSVTLTVGLIVWSAAQAATPAAAYLGLTPLLACRAIMGIGESCTFPSIQAIAAKWVPLEYRSRFWGFLTACFNLGTVAAYTGSPALIERYGWPDTFVVYGAAGIVLTAIWAAIGRDAPATLDLCVPDECDLPDEEEENSAANSLFIQNPETNVAETAWNRAKELPWGEIASCPAIWGMTAAAIASNYFLYFAIAWLPTYFSYEFNLDASAASTASAAPFAAAALGCFLAGNVADALVKRGVELTTVRKAAGLVSTCGPAAALLVLAVGGSSLSYETSEAIFIGALGLHAFNIAGYGVGVQDISQKSASLISGVTAGIGVMSGAASQYITGALLDSNGRDFLPVFYIAAAIQVFGAVAFTTLWDSERRFE